MKHKLFNTGLIQAEVSKIFARLFDRVDINIEEQVHSVVNNRLEAELVRQFYTQLKETPL